MDFTCVALKNILNQRMSKGLNPIKLVIMSATLSVKDFSAYFAAHRETSLFFIPDVIKGKPVE